MDEMRDFMSEEAKANSVSNEEEDNTDLSPVIKFAKPFMFEQEEYTELDLSGLENLSGSDMIAVNKRLQRTNPGLDVMPEVSLEYALYMASRATGLPIEFFMALPMKYAMQVKNRVMGFLFGQD